MDNNDRLFILIKSLNKNEKIYFKRYAKKQTNNYLKLFNEIDKQKVYDEPRLLKIFFKEKFSTRFRDIKGRLYYSILKSLQDYHYSDSTVKSEIKNNLRSVEILFKKGLYDLSSKLLEKIKSFAHTYDGADLLLLEIIEWESILLPKKKAIRTIEDITALKEKKDNALKRYVNQEEYRFLNEKLISIQIKQGNVLDKKSEKIIDELAKHPALKSEKNAISFGAKMLYYDFFIVYYRFKGNNALRSKFSKGQVDLIEGSPEIMKNEPSLYYNALDNLAPGYYDEKNYPALFATIEKIRNIPEKTIDMKVRKLNSFLLEMLAYNSIGEFQKTISLSAVFSKELKMYEKKIELFRQLHFFIEIAYAYFGLKDYRTSVRWLNKILNEKYATDRHMYTSALVFSLIVYYEMGNEELLETKIKPAIHFFIHRTPFGENNKSHYYYEISFIKFLQEILQENNHKNNIVSIRKFRDKMIRDSSNTTYDVDNYDLIINWLESKTEKKSFAEIIKEKAKPYL